MKRLLVALLVTGMSVVIAGELGTITGRVTDAATGEPIVNALVRLQSDSRRPVQVLTGRNGYWRADNLPPGEWRIGASARGYQPAAWPDPVTLQPGQTVEGIDFQLQPLRRGNGGISGRITDRLTGEPVGNAVVVARGPAGAGRAVTDRNGNYTIHGLPDGDYIVSAVARLYHRASYPAPVTVQSGSVVEGIDIALTPRPRRGVIVGRVVDAATGKPVVGALVLAVGEPGAFRARTNANGWYRLRVRPGVYRLSCNARGFEPAEYPEPVPVRPGAVVGGIDFELHRKTAERD